MNFKKLNKKECRQMKKCCLWVLHVFWYEVIKQKTICEDYFQTKWTSHGLNEGRLLWNVWQGNDAERAHWNIPRLFFLLLHLTRNLVVAVVRYSHFPGPIAQLENKKKNSVIKLNANSKYLLYLKNQTIKHS